MKMWGFILAIFIFSLLTSTFNDEGLINPGPDVAAFDTDAVSSDSSEIREVFSHDSAASEKSWYQDFPGMDLLLVVSRMFEILFNALAMTAYIKPTLISYGVPESLALLLQAIISLMEGVFLFQVWRRFKIEN